MQTLYALALEPVTETNADTVSFGFRRGRSAKDACEQIFAVLARKCSPTWVIEGDIKSCFDNIHHDWLMSNIPMDKRIMKQFLKSGFIYKGELFPTDTGSPQGGSISSIYANMTLDGLEKVIQDKYHRNSKGNIENHYRAKTKVNLVRYANDFIITANSKEIALELKDIVSEFLLGRGLMLSEEKTIITHIDEGFDFLGWNFRKYNGKPWMFITNEYTLINLRRIHIVRHQSLQISRNPFFRVFTDLLKGISYTVIYAEHFNMPNNICNFFLFPVASKEKTKKYVISAEHKINKICENIKNGIIKKRGFNIFSKYLGLFCQRFYFHSFEKKAKRDVKITADCIDCAKCTKICPMKNLKIINNKIEQNGNCTLCYRCVNMCPQKAITVFIHSKVKQQYKGIPDFIYTKLDV
ncbi:EFR1 family ferrodoxin [Petroclostridium sp. X23]|uniref:EFR1 family ferrodoxin n=1 Tax=Petroclostridium sp. X23 TaxID=3045146 RepID=UPI0024ACD088|nr:EFR1 family ferrodoxin [Petroclostridium sp. X23]WHH60034.1 EFR1 family ferrodoxin [Petroclostridium sp. X23]